VATLFNRDSVPSHLFDIRELDLSGDLFSERINGPWFRLGSNTIGNYHNNLGIEEFILRHSLLIEKGCFRKIFKGLESIGNVLHGIGKPQGTVFGDGNNKEYRYVPFYRFEFLRNHMTGEPLVFCREYNSRLFINPDILLFFELEERRVESGVIWWDSKLGVEALKHINQGNLEIVEITPKHLLRYMRERQMSLLVGHYRDLKLFDPPQDEIDRFIKEEVTLDSVKQGAKAIIENKIFTGLHQEQSLLRRLHLWFEIKPPKIDINDPWAEEPTFDIYKFTLPTSIGPMAPGVEANFKSKKGRRFAGSAFDFLTRVYFRQEVLAKYEGTANYDVDDDGSVHCQSYWGLYRSTKRYGNELISTYIGDFAEGVPLEEWMHWKQYAVDPPSRESLESISREQSIPEAINELIGALKRLNNTYKSLTYKFKISDVSGNLWNGSADSLAGRQLKYFYPSNARDDEFLKRATLLSTFIIDELSSPLLRYFLVKFGRDLDKNNTSVLGSMNLLQRVSLIVNLIKNFRPDFSEILELVKLAEIDTHTTTEPGLKEEIVLLYKKVREKFSPLAFLYELRNCGGVAHPPSRGNASKAAIKFGLPGNNWDRSHFLSIINQVADSINAIHGDMDYIINSY
jgi:hypothetical protein